MKEHLFVVRIWREYREIEEKEPRFRGVIQHAVTGHKHYFNEISHIATFLITQLNLTGSPEHLAYHAQLLEQQLLQSSLPTLQEPGVQDGEF